MKVHLMERVPGTRGALTVLELEFTSKARRVRVTTTEGLEALDLRGERAGGTYDAAPTLTRLHVPLRVTMDGGRSAKVTVVVEDAAGVAAAETWEGAVELVGARTKGPSTALLLAGFGAVVAGIAAFVVVPLLRPPTVPDVRNKPQAEAERALRSLGFAPVVELVPDHDESAGRVFAQVPDAGSQPPKSSPVTIRVGRPVRTIVMPQLVGRPRAEAEAALAGTGLVVETRTEEVADEQVDRVTAQRPAATEKAAAGTHVELVVGRRRVTTLRDVPDVGGLAVADAQAAIERAGLVAVLDQRDGPAETVGKVVAQVPAGGARLPQGEVVRVTVGREAAPAPIAEVPEVVGRPRAEAEAALLAAGFVPFVVVAEPTEGAAGLVSSQDPRSGTSRRGTRVTLRVPPAMSDPVAVTPPAMSDPVVVTPPAMSDPVVVTPPAMSDPVVVTPPAMSDPVAVTPPAMSDPVAVTPPAMSDPVIVTPPAMSDPVVVTPPAMSDPVVVTPPAMSDPVVVTPPPAVRVAPDLRGLTRDQAEAEIARAGVRVVVDTEDVSRDVPDGLVLRQLPTAGAPLGDGPITIVVARAPAPTPTPTPAARIAPDVVGMSRAAATEALAKAGLGVRVTDEDAGPDTPEGLVLHQAPSAGEAARDGVVELAVARRAVVPTPPARRAVPDVLGRAVEDAMRVLRDGGFVPRSQTEATLPERDGLVLRQEPTAGTSADAGSSVVLVVGRGEKPTAMTPPVVNPPVVNPPAVDPPVANPTGVLPTPLPPTPAGAALPPPRRITKGAPLPPPVSPTGTPPVSPAPSPTNPAPPVANPAPVVRPPVAPSVEPRRSLLGARAGQESVSVPDLGGRDVAEACEVAIRAGLVPVVASDRDARAPTGRVRMQSPAAGTSARTGTPVTLQVGAGASASMVDVPSVAGLSLRDAAARLSQAGFAVTTVRVVGRPGVFAGGDVVVAQTPLGQFAPDQARIVRLFVSDR